MNLTTAGVAHYRYHQEAGRLRVKHEPPSSKNAHAKTRRFADVAVVGVATRVYLRRG